MAAALAREPSLLIADEVTSMVDQDGREDLMSVLSGLTQRHRTSLVHITHYNDEADAADRTVNLTGNDSAAADNSGSADNVEMVETAEAPAASEVGEPRAARRFSSSTVCATSTAAEPLGQKAL